MFDAASPWSRRDLLRTVAATTITATMTACDSTPSAPPPPDALTAFYAETAALLAVYEAASTAHPELAPIRDAHRAHLAALASIMRPAPSGPPSGPSPTGTTVIDLTAIRQAETAAQRAAAQACLAAPSARATLLGEIAAARACHLEVLP